MSCTCSPSDLIASTFHADFIKPTHTLRTDRYSEYALTRDSIAPSVTTRGAATCSDFDMNSISSPLLLHSVYSHKCTPTTALLHSEIQSGGRRKSMLKKIKQKVSKSTTNLSELGHRIKSRKSSPEGNFENGGVDTPSTNFEQQEWGLPSTGHTDALGNISSKIGETPDGLHPEERAGKPKSEMTKRELVDLATLLEQRLIGTRTQLVRTHMEQNELNAKIEELNSELASARLQLTDLRNRLLEDNMTQYLEVGGGGSSSSHSLDTYLRPAHSELTVADYQRADSPHQSVTRLDQMKALFLGGASGRSAGGGGDSASVQNSPASTSNGLLSRAKALASKPFGVGASPGQPSVSAAPSQLPSGNPCEEDRILGRRKSRYAGEEYVPISIYPLCRAVTENATSTNEGCHVFTARLCPSGELGVAKIAAVTSPEEINVLRKFGFYGYAPGEERWQPDSAGAFHPEPDVIYLFDTEVISPVRVLWDLLCAHSVQTIGHAATPLISPASACPFSARYAAYVYYRSRGWIVRPALSLGAVDFLLYAQGPPWRHAAYAVLVLCDRTAESTATSSNFGDLNLNAYWDAPEAWDVGYTTLKVNI
ncbi:unnamed protein product [Schistocephalus solidus]|uniref:tRNA-intron lyase n=1 Tax=Schistocephalus solidus TaxID=70667 RepID=A0A183SV16_SCHSO|nr:unnamed protein product [Schistocephalus solidus]